MSLYLAQYSVGEQSLRQLAIRMESPLTEVPDHDATWQRRFQELVESILAMSTVDATYRISTSDRNLERIFVFTTEEGHEAKLHQIADAFGELNVLKSDCAQLSMNRRHHDEMLGWFPGQCGCFDNSPYPQDGFQLVPDFRFFPKAKHFLLSAFQNRWRFSYQANLRRHLPDPDEIRAARKNQVRVEEAPLPAKLIAHQQHLVANLASSGFLLDEYVGVESAEALQGLTQLIDEEMSTTLRPLGFSSSPLSRGQVDQLADFLFTGFHTSLLPSDNYLRYLGSRVDQRWVTSLLQWRPPLVKKPIQAPATPKNDGKPYDVFISYSSKDVETVQRLIPGLEKDDRLRCWMAPRDIPPGSNWAKSIMQGLDQCPVVVLVYSADSNVSPQVHREVERAVHKRKLLIPLRISDVPMCEEMEYMISVAHWFDAVSGLGDAHIESLAAAILRHLGENR